MDEKTENKKIIESVKNQYEKFPYPAHSTNLSFLQYFLNPTRPQTHVLTYEFGQYLRTGNYIEHTSNTRILVAGCGSFEPLVVAKAHPKAQIVALDLSSANLQKLTRHAFFLRLDIQCFEADLHEDLSLKLGKFDYILCTGVLHHSPTPNLLLKNLNKLLMPEAILRLMVYPFYSRLWIYELQNYFKEHRLSASTPNLKKSCIQLLQELPKDHPYIAAFKTYTDTHSLAGLVDGFFHAYDKPVPILELQNSCLELDLHLIGFGHAWHSQPQAFDRLVKRATHDRVVGESASNSIDKKQTTPSWLKQKWNTLHSWEKLMFLDSIMELSTNPILWLAPNPKPVKEGYPQEVCWNPVLKTRFNLGGKRVKAPLMPPLTTDLYVQDRLPLFLKIPPKNSLKYERWIDGGWLLGADGILPSRFFNTRSVEIRSTEKNSSSFLDFLYVSYFKKNQSIFPATAQLKMLEGLSQAIDLLKLENKKEVQEFTRFLSTTLESYIDLEGNDIPYYTTADFLRTN